MPSSAHPPRKRGFRPVHRFLPMAAAAVLLVRSGIETRGRGLKDIKIPSLRHQARRAAASAGAQAPSAPRYAGAPRACERLFVICRPVTRSRSWAMRVIWVFMHFVAPFRSTRYATTLGRRLAWTSWTGSRLLQRRAHAHGNRILAPVEGNSASWLRDLVYVETMQGHLYRSPPALALRDRSWTLLRFPHRSSSERHCASVLRNHWRACPSGMPRSCSTR